MRNILIFAAVLVGLGIYHGGDGRQDAGSRRRSPTACPAKPPVEAPARKPAAAATPFRRDARGHFSTEGRVDGHRIGFMVDTGASVIALTEKSAARFGIRPSRSDYNAPVSTANGVIKAARARLAMVEIGGLEVRDVDAMVLPDEVLSENLLGLSYLSRLRRFEYADGKLVLEQ